MNSFASSSFKRSSIWACKSSLYACAIFNCEFIVNNCNKKIPTTWKTLSFWQTCVSCDKKNNLILHISSSSQVGTPSEDMHLPKLWKTNGLSSCVLFTNKIEIPMWNLHLPKHFATYKPSSKSQPNKIRSPKEGKKPSCCFATTCVGQLWTCTISSFAIVAKSHYNLDLPSLNTQH